MVRSAARRYLPLERVDERTPLLRGDLGLTELRPQRLHRQLGRLQRGLQPVHLALQPRRVRLQPAVLRRLVRVRVRVGVGVRVRVGARARARVRSSNAPAPWPPHWPCLASRRAAPVPPPHAGVPPRGAPPPVPA
eukprot:scaffold84498_cov75-Phaeocystis_antarctica.AAC.2